VSVPAKVHGVIRRQKYERMIMSEWITAKEIYEDLGIHINTLDNWIKRGWYPTPHPLFTRPRKWRRALHEATKARM
jgi:hypothetical protein